MIIDRIGRHEIVLPINHKNYNFREEKNSHVMKVRENLHSKTDRGDVNCFVALKLRLVDLNYNFECDWLIELFDNNCLITNCPITTW